MVENNEKDPVLGNMYIFSPSDTDISSKQYLKRHLMKLSHKTYWLLDCCILPQNALFPSLTYSYSEIVAHPSSILYSVYKYAL